MDILYRIFYTVLSLGILMALLFPVVIVIRFLLRNFEKKYTILSWWIFFLRSICPIALSSALCIVPSWNRKYQQLLSLFGLTIQDNHGILRSWKSVFEHDISVTEEFRICSIIWVTGVIGVMLFAIANAHKLKKEMQPAKELSAAIYETEKLSVPVRLGFLRGKLYLPMDFQTKEMKWLLPHMEIHAKEMSARILVLFVMAVHWFNPIMWLYHYWWNSDMEMACDDKTVAGKKENDRKAYAQGLVNFKRESKKRVRFKGFFSGPFFVGIREENTEKRARRMMYPTFHKTSDKMLSWMVLSLLLVFVFLLRPMQLAWSGGTWGNGKKTQKEEPLFTEKEAFVLTKMGTKSPEGLEWILQLEMEEGEEYEQGYKGDFVLKVYDLMENEIASRKVANIFPELKAGEQYFPNMLTLCISDYNGDGTQELVLGQQSGTVEGEEDGVEYELFSYVLINIGNETLDVACRDILATDMDLSESIPFEKIEGIDDIFIVPERENKLYYVWNDTANTYEKREMTEEDIEAHKQNADRMEASGEVQEHTLEKADGTEAVLVSTRLDNTQSEAIQSVTLSPRGMPEKFEDVQGYYCDLKWLEEDAENRYAHLIYNGSKSQTFILYETKMKNVYYRHEDGTQQLRDIFAQYRESDITFDEGGAVIYDLTEKKEDVLTIQFAAEADGGVTIKGSYQYNVVKREASNLSFTRTMEEE